MGFCIDRRIVIRASHVGGVHNCRADFLSRISSPEHTYFLSQDVFDSLSELLPFSLEIDCFASRLDHKLPTFFARYLDPEASGVDAFSFRWEDGVYLFPPVPIIDRVLAKFRNDEVGHGLLICPYWPSQPWFSSILEMLISSPFSLPSGSVVDSDSILPRHSLLLALPIGCCPRSQREFQRGLPVRCSGASSLLPLLGTRDSGVNSTLGFIGNRVVTVLLL